MSDTSRIRVNLSAVEHNVAVMRRIVGSDCKLCPIVKADGYGLGAAQVARHLTAAGADMLAVYTTAQAAALARAAVGGPILVLQPVREMERVDEAYRLLIRGDLHLTAHDDEHVSDLLRLAEHFATTIPIHLEVDTGMSRGGCRPEDMPGIIKRIADNRWLHLAGIATHFARAKTDARFTTKQLTAFDKAVGKCGRMIPADCIVHVANTCATIRNKRFHKTMVRFGQAWAGLGAAKLPDGPGRRVAEALLPVVTWRSEIVQVKTVESGSSVGYGSRWTAPRRTRLGLVPVGYADGYPLTLAATDEVDRPPCVGVEHGKSWQYVRVVGHVNMDQLMIDLTDVASPRQRRAAVGVGASVELIGADPEAPNHVETLAEAAGTIPHELLCRLSPRLPRLYHAKEQYQETAAVAAGSRGP